MNWLDVKCLRQSIIISRSRTERSIYAECIFRGQFKSKLKSGSGGWGRRGHWDQCRDIHHARDGIKIDLLFAVSKSPCVAHFLQLVWPLAKPIMRLAGRNGTLPREMERKLCWLAVYSRLWGMWKEFELLSTHSAFDAFGIRLRFLSDSRQTEEPHFGPTLPNVPVSITVALIKFAPAQHGYHFDRSLGRLRALSLGAYWLDFAQFDLHKLSNSKSATTNSRPSEPNRTHLDARLVFIRPGRYSSSLTQARLYIRRNRSGLINSFRLLRLHLRHELLYQEWMRSILAIDIDLPSQRATSLKPLPSLDNPYLNLYSAVLIMFPEVLSKIPKILET